MQSKNSIAVPEMILGVLAILNWPAIECNHGTLVFLVTNVTNYNIAEDADPCIMVCFSDEENKMKIQRCVPQGSVSGPAIKDTWYSCPASSVKGSDMERKNAANGIRPIQYILKIPYSSASRARTVRLIPVAKEITMDITLAEVKDYITAACFMFSQHKLLFVTSEAEMFFMYLNNTPPVRIEGLKAVDVVAADESRQILVFGLWKKDLKRCLVRGTPEGKNITELYCIDKIFHQAAVDSQKELIYFGLKDHIYRLPYSGGNPTRLAEAKHIHTFFYENVHDELLFFSNSKLVTIYLGNGSMSSIPFRLNDIPVGMFKHEDYLYVSLRMYKFIEYNLANHSIKQYKSEDMFLPVRYVMCGVG